MAKKKDFYYGTGKRKASIAKVKLVSGTGKITVNGKDVHEYLPYERSCYPPVWSWFPNIWLMSLPLLHQKGAHENQLQNPLL